jgi:pyruvate carboxylase
VLKQILTKFKLKKKGFDLTASACWISRATRIDEEHLLSDDYLSESGELRDAHGSLLATNVKRAQFRQATAAYDLAAR